MLKFVRERGQDMAISSVIMMGHIACAPSWSTNEQVCRYFGADLTSGESQTKRSGSGTTRLRGSQIRATPGAFACGLSQDLLAKLAVKMCTLGVKRQTFRLCWVNITMEVIIWTKHTPVSNKYALNKLTKLVELPKISELINILFLRFWNPKKEDY